MKKKSAERINSLLLFTLAAIVIGVTVFVRIRLLATPLERDEGEYAYMGQLLLKGIMPYKHAYTMKLPGVAGAYALFMGLFGPDETGIRIGLLLVNIASIVMVYLLGQRLFNRKTAYASAAIYALLSINHAFLGIFAHATHFVVFFSLAALLALDNWLDNRSRTVLFLCGALIGMAILMKQHAALQIPFALSILLFSCAGKGDKKAAFDCAILLTGVTLPYAVIAAAIYKAGLFENFWFWTVSYASEYATLATLSQGMYNLSALLKAVGMTLSPVFILAGAGILTLHIADSHQRVKLFLTGYLITSLLMISASLHFMKHYLIMLLPVLAILAGYAVTESAQPARRLKLYRSLPLVPALLLSAVLSCIIYTEREYLFQLSPVETSMKIYGINPFPEAVHIGRYLQQNSALSDRIAILGSEPEILFYSNRLSATGHIYMYGLMEQHQFAEKMQHQLMAEIEATRPAFIVMVNIETSWLRRPTSGNAVHEWAERYTSLHYDTAGIIEIPADAPTRYYWGAQTSVYLPSSINHLLVFKRRPE